MIHTLFGIKKTNPNISGTRYMEQQSYTLSNYEEDCFISIGQRDEKGTTSLFHPDKKIVKFQI